MDPFENSHQKGSTTSAANSTWFFAPPCPAPEAGNTGQVVAELKVVTSNKLCEPIL